MASLGDLFPEKLKNEVVNQNIEVGSVFRLHETTTTPPKIKRFIILGKSANAVMLAVVYINTDINPNLFSTPELKSLHLLITATERSYIDHDSYVDCSQIIEKNVEEVKQLYSNDMQCHLGNISESDFKDMKAIIKGTRTISLRKKKEYGLFL